MATPGNGGPAQSPEAEQKQVQLGVLAQYIKDFSFENPNAPRSLTPTQTQPAINIQINVGAQQLAETDYEISLKIECPRLLFPFAREIVATAVRNGGFPPLLLDPVDFVALYQQRMAQMQPPQAAAP